MLKWPDTVRAVRNGPDPAFRKLANSGWITAGRRRAADASTRL